MGMYTHSGMTSRSSIYITCLVSVVNRQDRFKVSTDQSETPVETGDQHLQRGAADGQEILEQEDARGEGQIGEKTSGEGERGQR